MKQYIPLNEVQDNLIDQLVKYKFVSRFLKSSDDILDAACNNGYGTLYLTQFCHYITATDDNKELIETAKSKKVSNIEFVQASKFSDKQFDSTICFNYLNKFNRNELSQFLKYLSIITKENGFIFCSISNNKKNYSISDFRKDLDTVFTRSIVFGQIDEIIGPFDYDITNEFIAICIN